MKITHSGLVAVALLSLAGAAAAQASGGPEAKGNAPLKSSHTVNDGPPKAGANSFTQAQARRHILNAGYGAVTSLSKGPDGVWRGVAIKNAAAIHVALDFKGNVTEATPTSQ